MTLGWTSTGLGVLLAASVAAGQVPDHLECYAIKDELPRSAFTADLEGLTPEPGCTIKLPAKKLCVETVERNVTPVPPEDIQGSAAGVFLCYSLRCPGETLASVEVRDQFGRRRVAPRRSRLLCAPAARLPPCEDSGYPACAGSCSPGRVCQAIRTDLQKVFCSCVAEGSQCGDGGTPAPCTGVCPPGTACTVAVLSDPGCYGCRFP
jgi:hypothetical protein